MFKQIALAYRSLMDSVTGYLKRGWSSTQDIAAAEDPHGREALAEPLLGAAGSPIRRDSFRAGSPSTRESPSRSPSRRSPSRREVPQLPTFARSQEERARRKSQQFEELRRKWSGPPGEVTSIEEFNKLCAAVAHRCGQGLLEQVESQESHAIFDCTLEHALRLYETACDEALSDAPAAAKAYSVAAAAATAAAEDGPLSPATRPFHEVRGTWEETEGSEEVLPAVMSKDLLIRALAHDGFHGLSDEPMFEELWQACQRELINVHAFHYILRLLKLQLLCVSAGLAEETGFIGRLDWNARSLDEHYFHRLERPADMFLHHRHPSMKMRWVHCAAVGRVSLLRLAAKYQLHPLPVEDTIKLNQQSVPFLRRYGNNFFMHIPLLRLADRDRCSGRRPSLDSELTPASTYSHPLERCNSHVGQDLRSGPSDVQVEQARLAIFISGPPQYDTVITVQTKWQRRELEGGRSKFDDVEKSGRWRGLRKVSRFLRGFAHSRGGETECPPSGSTKCSPHPPPTHEGSHENSDGEPFGTQAFDLIAHEILKDFSMLRVGNATWLLWRLLDVCVDELMPILSAYRSRLQWFSAYIASRKAAASLDVDKQLLRSKVDLDWLQRKARPLVRVVKHLIREATIESDVKRYIEDVEDHLETFIEEMSRCMAMCDSLREQVRSHRDRQQQHVLYALTIVTTLFTPMQLLTGIYGMNFQDDEGLPVVPGLGSLTKDRGWYLFWALGCSIVFGLLFVFRFFLRWI